MADILFRLHIPTLYDLFIVKSSTVNDIFCEPLSVFFLFIASAAATAAAGLE